MDPSVVLAFAALALTLIVVPGPDWAFVLAAGARERSAVPAVGGLLIGYTALSLVVAGGVGPLVTAAPAALPALTVCGAAYLMWLGVRTLRAPGHVPGGPAGAASPRRSLVRGIGVSALNPKGLLLFLSVLPQFARTSARWPVPVQLVVLGGVFVAICGVFYLLLGHLAGRVLATRPSLTRVATRVAGVAMILVGIALLVERAVETL